MPLRGTPATPLWQLRTAALRRRCVDFLLLPYTSTAGTQSLKRILLILTGPEGPFGQKEKGIARTGIHAHITQLPGVAGDAGYSPGPTRHHGSLP